MQLRMSVARAQPGDWRYWLLAAQAAMAAPDCSVLAESVARLAALRPGHSQLSPLRDGMLRLRCIAGSAPPS
jgi:hypothetical protein